MDRYVFQNIPKNYSETDILKSVNGASELPEDENAELLELIRGAERIANPKALLRISAITERGDGYVEIDGKRIDCALMAENFRDIYRVFPYICTCGREAEEWSQTLRDPLHEYWADKIKLFYVHNVQKYLFNHVRENYIQKAHISRMNPGSLKEWPISEQAVLFSIIGDIYELIGVELTPSFLMLPSKSTSGIMFASEAAFENCSLCDMKDCPGRRAEYAGK